MNEYSAPSHGELISVALWGSWRESPPSTPSLSPEQLEAVTPLLYDSGAGALGWWRIRQTALRDSPSAELLHQALRHQVLLAEIQKTRVQKIFRLLRAAEVEPILMKGWAVGRLYPQSGLRPSGDIDLFIRPRDYRAALAVIKSEKAQDCWIDLHDRIFGLADRSSEDLFSRSELVSCGDEQVRVLGFEDHFALLAIHLLKHGAWRPLWLCDLGLLLESMTDDFDWELCLGRNKRQANWILSAVGLARRLVGAQIVAGNDDIAARSRQIPEWLVPAVLRQWESPFNTVHENPTPMVRHLRHPEALIRAIPKRWPDPIRATVNLGGEFNHLPRAIYQVSYLALRALRFLYRLPTLSSFSTAGRGSNRRLPTPRRVHL